MFGRLSRLLVLLCGPVVCLSCVLSVSVARSVVNIQTTQGSHIESRGRSPGCAAFTDKTDPGGAPRLSTLVNQKVAIRAKFLYVMKTDYCRTILQRAVTNRGRGGCSPSELPLTAL